MTARPTLPQNGIPSGVTPVLFEDFETATGWSDIASPHGTVALDSTHFMTGAHSLKLTTPSANNWCQAVKALSLPIGPQRLHLMVYTEDAANILNLRIYTTTQALFTKYLSADMIANCALVNGWNHLVIHPSQWTSVAGDDLQGQTINLQIALRGRDVVSAYVDSMYLGELGKPTAVICFDDAMPSQYTYAKPAMLAKGFRGTMAIPSAGVDVANRMTTAQIQEIYADGWDVMNHSDTHPNFTTLTEAERIAEMNTCAAYLAANGLVRGADHFAFPGNSADAASMATVAAYGMKSMRGVLGPYITCWPFPKTGDCIHIQHHNLLYMGNTTTTANVDSAVLAAERSGGTLFVLIHSILASPTSSVEVSETVFDYLLTKLAERKIQVKTVSEWYNGLTNPRYQSLPVGRT